MVWSYYKAVIIGISDPDIETSPGRPGHRPHIHPGQDIIRNIGNLEVKFDRLAYVITGSMLTLSAGLLCVLRRTN